LQSILKSEILAPKNNNTKKVDMTKCVSHRFHDPKKFMAGEQ